jgi:hypothetical protein
MYFILSSSYLNKSDLKKFKVFLIENSLKFFLLSKKNDDSFFKEIKKIVSGNVFVIKSNLYEYDSNFLSKLNFELDKIKTLEKTFNNKLLLLFIIYKKKYIFQKINLIYYNNYNKFFNSKHYNQISIISIKILIKLLNTLFLIQNNNLISKLFFYNTFFNSNLINYY